MQMNSTVTTGSTGATSNTGSVVQTAVDNSIKAMEQYGDAGDMAQQMTELLKLMLMIAVKLREARQQLMEQQSNVALEKAMTGLETALKGIEKQAEASKIKAFAEILSGVLSAGGAVLGAAKGNEFISSGASALGKAWEGYRGLDSANEAQQGQILSNQSEFQKTVAESNRQALADLQSKLEEAMREVLTTARDLTEKIGGLIQAVKIQ